MKTNRLTWLFLISILLITCRPNPDDMPPEPPIVSEWEGLSFMPNPAGVNPLCARLDVATNVAGKVRVEVVGQDGEASNITHIFPEIPASLSIPILGLYPDYENIVNVSLLNEDNQALLRKELKITTEALPDNHPNITIITTSPEKMEPGLTLISNRSNIGSHRPYMIDAFGKVRWVLDFTGHTVLGNLFYDVGMERLQNGNLYFGNGSTNAIYEIDVYGEIVNTWNLPGYSFHHNVQEKFNGNFLVTVTKYDSEHQNGYSTKEDYIIEIDRQTGLVLMEWDLKQSLDEWRNDLSVDLDNEPIDWAHANAVIYDESDNTIIVSCRKQGVVKLDYENNVVWILSPHRGWGTNRKGDDLNDFLLNPLDANGLPITDSNLVEGTVSHVDFDWNWYQHAPLIMPNGHLMLFDNGAQRNFGGSPTYSRAVEYDIDVTAMTVRQVWQYGKERGVETYSGIVSDVDLLPKTTNVLFCPGYCNNLDVQINGGRVIEVNYDTREVVFEVFLNGGVANMQFHRAERLSIYP